MKKDILRLGTSLAIYAAAACVALAFVYAITAPAIAGHERQQLEQSLKDIFPEADTFSVIQDGLKAPDTAVAFNAAYKAMRGDALLGLAVKATGKSYGGAAVLIVGVGTDRRVAGARILTLSDTPGLGANAQNPAYFVDKTSKTTFLGQFKGKAVADQFAVKGDVIAISASTITSKALAGIVQRVGAAGSAWLESAATGGGK